MKPRTVAIIGAGAAGNAAARALRTSGADVEVQLFTRTRDRPYNRTLINKGVAIGLLSPDQIALSDAATPLSADTVRGLDPRTRRVHLDSGASQTFDALIVSTGSRPRQIGDRVIGRDQAIGASRLTTLHSLADAVRVRDQLAITHPARVLILGGGLVAAETASLLVEAGHDTALIARSQVPAEGAIGIHGAQRVLHLHQLHHATYLGRNLQAIRTHSDHVTVVLDDNTQVDGDLIVVAHGTIPAAPAPWNGPGGIPVDSRMRALPLRGQRIYAAGGLAVHHYPGHASYRIDHWDDSAAQGAHAARTLLHDLGHGDDPGTYLPTATFSTRIHGHTLTGAGHPALGTSAQVMSTEPLLVAHHLGDTLVALIGIDAVPLVHEYASRLHAPHRSQTPTSL